MSLVAADIMSKPPIVAAPSASLAELARLLSERKISAVPIVHPDGSLAGIVSEADLLRPFRESAMRRRAWWLEMLADGEALSQDFLDYLRQDTRTASDVMARAVVTADERTSLPQLAELMTSRALKRVPILREGVVIGIVSRSDLVAAMANAPAMFV